MYVGKNPFCRPSVPLRGARRATAGKLRVNFAKFTRSFPHVPICRKRPQAFFDRLRGHAVPPDLYINCI